jgi:hypothetical protein
VGAAVGDHGRFAALGEKDSERFAEQDGSLRTTRQVLEPRDRLPAVAQRQGDLLAGRRLAWLVVKHHRSS